MASPLDEALKKLRADSMPNLNPTKVVDNPISKALASPKVQTSLAEGFAGLKPAESTTKGPKGVFGQALNVLGYPKSFIASTAKEAFDLVQGEGFNVNDWWRQGTTDYGMGDLIREERTATGAALIAMSPFTMGVSGLLGAGVLADNINLDRTIGFIGDVAVDPLTYMGGFNIITRGLAGVKKARMGLVSMQKLGADELLKKGIASSADEAAQMLKAVDEAIVAGEKVGTMSGIARSLRKTPAGQKVAENLGFNPGLRLRVPGTGAIARTFKDYTPEFLKSMTDNVKIPGWAFKQQLRNVPKFYKSKYGAFRVEEAMKVARLGRGRNASKGAKQAWKKLRDESPELADIAGRAVKSAVEFAVPSVGKNASRGLLAASLFGRADLPVTLTKGAFEKVAPKAFQKSRELFTSTWLDEFTKSGDANKVADGWLIEDYSRAARGKKSFYSQASNKSKKETLREFKLAGFDPVEDADLLSQLDEADILFRNPADGSVIRGDNGEYVNRNSEWFRQLDPRLQALPDEQLQRLKATLYAGQSERRRILNEVLGAVSSVNPRGGWAAADNLVDNEGDQFLHRLISDEMRADLGLDDLFPNSNSAFKASDPNSLKTRRWKYVKDDGGDVTANYVDIGPDTALFEKFRKAGRLVEIDGEFFVIDPRTGLPFQLQDPAVVGRSVRRQMDELFDDSIGQKAFEGNWAKIIDDGDARMATFLENRYLRNRIDKLGSEFDDWWGKSMAPATRGGPSPAGPINIGVIRHTPVREIEGQKALPKQNIKRLETYTNDLNLEQANLQAYTDGLFTAAENKLTTISPGGAVTGLSEPLRASVNIWKQAQNRVIEIVPESKIIIARLENIGDQLDQLTPDPKKVADMKYKVPDTVRRLVDEAEGAAARLEELKTEIEEAILPVQRAQARTLVGENTEFKDLNDAFNTMVLNIDSNLAHIRNDLFPYVNEQARRLNLMDQSVQQLNYIGDRLAGLPVTSSFKQLNMFADEVDEIKRIDNVVKHKEYLDATPDIEVLTDKVLAARQQIALNDDQVKLDLALSGDNITRESVVKQLDKNAQLNELLDSATNDLLAAQSAASVRNPYLASAAVIDGMAAAREAMELSGRYVEPSPPPSFNQWEEMAKTGRIRQAKNIDLPGEAQATTAYEMGIINGYSEADIARHYYEINIEGIDFNKMGGFKGSRGAFKAATAEDKAWAYKMFSKDRDAYYTKTRRNAAMEKGGKALDDTPGKLLAIPNDTKTMALVLREGVTNYRNTYIEKYATPVRGAGGGPSGPKGPTGNGGVSGMMGGGPWEDEYSGILEAFAFLNDPKRFASRDSTFWKGWDKVQNYLKAAMIATPGFINRNIFGAFFNAAMDGVNPAEIFRSVKMSNRVWAYANQQADSGRPMSFLDAARELAKTDTDFEDFVGLVEMGVRGGGQAVTAVEMQQTVGGLKSLDYVFGLPGKRGKRVGGTGQVSFAPWSPQFAPYQAVRAANGWVEDMIRIGVGMDTLKAGGSLDDALNRIAKTQFDYSELTTFEEEWLRRFIPFYTWTRKNLPYQLNQFGRNPAKYRRLMAAKKNLELGTQEDGVVPDWYLEPFGIRLPFGNKGATAYTVPDLPFQDLLRYDPTAQGIGDVVKNLGWQVTPIIKTPIEVATQERFLAGIPFRGKYQTVPKPIQAMKFLLPVLDQVGWAKKDPVSGEWRMRDHHIYAVGNLLPTIGMLRRIWPNEERYQKRQMSTLLSVLGGLNVQFNTPDVQYSWQKSQQWEQMRQMQDAEDLFNPDR